MRSGCSCFAIIVAMLAFLSVRAYRTDKIKKKTVDQHRDESDLVGTSESQAEGKELLRVQEFCCKSSKYKHDWYSCCRIVDGFRPFNLTSLCRNKFNATPGWMGWMSTRWTKSKNDCSEEDCSVLDLPANAQVVRFEERPFGFSLDLDDASGRLTVGWVSGHAEAKGVAPGMVLVTVGGHAVDELQRKGVMNLVPQVPLPANVVFETGHAPREASERNTHVVSFDQQPFDFWFGLDRASGRFIVQKVMGHAEDKGVAPGMVIVTVAGHAVDGLRMESVTDLLRQASLPARVVFETVHAPREEPERSVSFDERPFGISFLDDVNGRLIVHSVEGHAEEKGVAPGMVLVTVGGRAVDGLRKENVVDLLKQASLPARLVFKTLRPTNFFL